MKSRVALLLLLFGLCGCGGPLGKTFSVLFQPYTSGLDPKAQDTVRAAATFADAHPEMPLSIAGDATRPEAGDFDTLRQQRVAVVRDALVREGVKQWRIQVLGTGILYPDGDPNLVPTKVTINVGL